MNSSQLGRSGPNGVHGIQAEQLEVLLKAYRFSVKRGDLQILNGRWYVTHVGLIGLAARRRCVGVHTEAVARALRTSCLPLDIQSCHL